MALNTIASYDLKGILDNCQDYVDQIVPEDTPFYNALAKIPHRSGSFKWVQDWNDGDVLGHTLGTNVAGGRLELKKAEDVATGDSENAPISKQSETLNYTQIFRKYVKVSKSAAQNAVHGRTNEAVYQIAKAVSALKNQIEGTFISGQTKAVATTSTPAKTDGLTAQIPTEMFVSTSNAAGVDELCDKLFQNGSMADTIYCNRKGYTAIINTITAAQSVNRKLEWLMVNAVEHKGIMTYTDKNGRLYKLITHRHLDEISEDNIVAIFLNHDDFQCVVFRDWQIIKLDTQGSYDEYQISCEVGLRHSGKYKAGVVAAAPTPSPAPKSAK